MMVDRRYTLVVLLVVFAFVGSYACMMLPSTPTHSSSCVACACKRKQQHIATLLRQTARWAVASRQDENAVIAVLHANYAVGYLGALKDVATDEEVQAVLGDADYTTFKHEIQGVQDAATIQLGEACGGAAPPSDILLQIAREAHVS